MTGHHTQQLRELLAASDYSWPWQRVPREDLTIADAFLAVAAVNALPALLDIADAAQRLIDITHGKTRPWRELQDALDKLNPQP